MQIKYKFKIQKAFWRENSDFFFSLLFSILAPKILFFFLVSNQDFVHFSIRFMYQESQKKIRWIFLHLNELFPSSSCSSAVVRWWWHCIKSSPHVSGPELQWTLLKLNYTASKISGEMESSLGFFERWKGEIQKHLNEFASMKT